MKKGLGVIILIIIFYIGLSIYAGITELTSHLSSIEFYLIIPILLSFTCSMIIKGIRQNYFLNQIDIRIPFRQNLLIYLAGLSMLITPGGIGGLIKSHFLKRNYGMPISRTSPVVILERYHDVLAVFSILLLSYMTIRIPILTFPIIMIGVFLLSCLLILRNKRMLKAIIGKLTKIKILNSFEKSSSELPEVLFALYKKEVLLKGWIISLTAWIFDALGIYLCFKAFGLSFDFISTTVLGFSSILFGAFSFIPAGIGVTEFSFVKLLSIYGISISMSTALILFWRIMGDFYSTCVGMIITKFVLLKKQVY